jgi:hypothetical protein
MMPASPGPAGKQYNSSTQHISDILHKFAESTDAVVDFGMNASIGSDV